MLIVLSQLTSASATSSRTESTATTSGTETWNRKNNSKYNENDIMDM